MERRGLRAAYLSGRSTKFLLASGEISLRARPDPVWPPVQQHSTAATRVTGRWRNRHLRSRVTSTMRNATVLSLPFSSSPCTVATSVIAERLDGPLSFAVASTSAYISDWAEARRRPYPAIVYFCHTSMSCSAITGAYALQTNIGVLHSSMTPVCKPSSGATLVHWLSACIAPECVS